MFALVRGIPPNHKEIELEVVKSVWWVHVYVCTKCFMKQLIEKSFYETYEYIFFSHFCMYNITQSICEKTDFYFTLPFVIENNEKKMKIF